LSSSIKKRRFKINEYCRKRYADDPIPFQQRNKKCRAKHRDKRNQHMVEYRKNHVDSIKKYREQWYLAHGKKYFREYRRFRTETDIQVRLAARLRSRLYYALKRGQKTGSAIQDLGCSIAEFERYFESLFTEGMSWSEVRSGKIHIDHIIPISAFDLTDPNEVKKACHYTNLQPLWAIDNLRKGGIRS
jgi:hypothetical protein